MQRKNEQTSLNVEGYQVDYKEKLRHHTLEAYFDE